MTYAQKSRPDRVALTVSERFATLPPASQGEFVTHGFQESHGEAAAAVDQFFQGARSAVLCTVSPAYGLPNGNASTSTVTGPSAPGYLC
jgi:hypothetical protein